MSGRLPTGIVVGALLRRVNDAGGIGMVRARGDAESGGVLVIVEGTPTRLLERALDLDGATVLVDATPAGADAEAIEAYWRRRRQRDPDLWVLELDIPGAERFAAETIASN